MKKIIIHEKEGLEYIFPFYVNNKSQMKYKPA